MAGPTGGADAPDLAGADKVNLGFIALIVAVATIGGFMFGYDSGVVNGTQKGLEGAFSLDEAGLGVAVAAQIAGDICRDNGNSAVAGVSELAAKAAIIALALPLIKSAVALAKELINI